MRLMRLEELPWDFAQLKEESEREGFRFLTKLSANWQAGKNRFDQKGECLFGAFSDLSSDLTSGLSFDSEKDSLLGIGGLNQDPYLKDPAVGRVRHVYVTSRARRLGLGRKIVIIFSDLLFVVGSFIMAFSNSIIMLMIGRFIV